MTTAGTGKVLYDCLYTIKTDDDGLQWPCLVFSNVNELYCMKRLYKDKEIVPKVKYLPFANLICQFREQSHGDPTQSMRIALLLRDVANFALFETPGKKFQLETIEHFLINANGELTAEQKTAISRMTALLAPPTFQLSMEDPPATCSAANGQNEDELAVKPPARNVATNSQGGQVAIDDKEKAPEGSGDVFVGNNAMYCDRTDAMNGTQTSMDAATSSLKNGSIEQPSNPPAPEGMTVDESAMQVSETMEKSKDKTVVATNSQKVATLDDTDKMKVDHNPKEQPSDPPVQEPSKNATVATRMQERSPVRYKRAVSPHAAQRRSPITPKTTNDDVALYCFADEDKTFKDVRQILSKGGYTFGMNKFCLPDSTQLATEEEFRATLCRDGVNCQCDGKKKVKSSAVYNEHREDCKCWTEDEMLDIHSYVRYNILTNTPYRRSVTMVDPIEKTQFLELLGKVGFTYDGSVHHYQALTFFTPKDLTEYIARHGLPNTCDLSGLSEEDLFNLELYAANYWHVNSFKPEAPLATVKRSRRSSSSPRAVEAREF